MKKIFNDIDDVSKLFLAQTQYFAGTPLTYIQGQGKGRRFYFKGDTIYSYRDSYPLAKIVGNSVYLKPPEYSNTTKKHNVSVYNALRNSGKLLIISDNLKTPNYYDNLLKSKLISALNSRKQGFLYKHSIQVIVKQTIQPITKSNFPLLFDKKHNKLKQMFFSNDIETFNMAKKIIKQQKLI